MPPFVIGGAWYQPISKKFFVGINNDWVEVGDKFHTHSQGVVSDTWTIVHNLVKFPSATVVDSGGTIVEGEIIHTDNNTLTIFFSAGFSGVAYLN